MATTDNTQSNDQQDASASEVGLANQSSASSNSYATMIHQMLPTLNPMVLGLGEIGPALGLLGTRLNKNKPFFHQLGQAAATLTPGTSAINLVGDIEDKRQMVGMAQNAFADAGSAPKSMLAKTVAGVNGFVNRDNPQQRLVGSALSEALDGDASTAPARVASSLISQTVKAPKVSSTLSENPMSAAAVAMSDDALPYEKQLAMSSLLNRKNPEALAAIEQNRQQIQDAMNQNPLQLDNDTLQSRALAAAQNAPLPAGATPYTDDIWQNNPDAFKGILPSGMLPVAEKLVNGNSKSVAASDVQDMMPAAGITDQNMIDKAGLTMSRFSEGYNKGAAPFLDEVGAEASSVHPLLGNTVKAARSIYNATANGKAAGDAEAANQLTGLDSLASKAKGWMQEFTDGFTSKVPGLQKLERPATQAVEQTQQVPVQPKKAVPTAPASTDDVAVQNTDTAPPVPLVDSSSITNTTPDTSSMDTRSTASSASAVPESNTGNPTYNPDAVVTYVAPADTAEDMDTTASAQPVEEDA